MRWVAAHCNTLLAAGSEAGGPDHAELTEVAAKWLVVATVRDENGDGAVDDAALQSGTYALSAELGALEDEATREALLYGAIDQCEAMYQRIREEFDGALAAD